ncbi:hypothetical protein KJ359_006564 [Pestalotiopsis sp. 9143b]|nr:hypothetical protein KJ359_006564 [Pestalotiopsis sp. 9143b]
MTPRPGNRSIYAHFWECCDCRQRHSASEDMCENCEHPRCGGCPSMKIKIRSQQHRNLGDDDGDKNGVGNQNINRTRQRGRRAHIPRQIFVDSER